MDTGNGRFVQLTEKEQILNAMKREVVTVRDKQYPAGPVFQVGEELEIKGSLFRIDKLGTKFMKLRLLPKKGK